MQRKWTPVLVASHEPDNKLGQARTDSKATADDDGRTDLRFAIGASLALGLPALIGAGIYLAVTIALKMS
jgi:hypothetical protein